MLPLKPEDIGDAINPDQLILLAQSFVMLANYVHKQQAKCGTITPNTEPVVIP